TVAAFLLALRGFNVLHGAVVGVGTAGLGIIGPSGVGKTTVAALCCAAGATLVSDDVLALDASVPPQIAGGWPELRLRPTAVGIVDLFPARPIERPTADGRLAVLCPAIGTERLELAALVVPRPSRSATDVVVTR